MNTLFHEENVARVLCSESAAGKSQMQEGAVRKVARESFATKKVMVSLIDGAGRRSRSDRKRY